MRQPPVPSRIGTLTCALFLFVAPVSQAAAQSGERVVDIHGFGGWAYGRTNRNFYRGATPDGNYLNANFALNVIGQVGDRLTAVAQVFAKEEGGEEAEFELDFAFAQWTVSDALKLKVGKIKHPFGIYTEVFDVGTVRPFYDLPPALYSAVGFVSEGFMGVGIHGSHRMGGGWGLAYDGYAGGLSLSMDQAPLIYLAGAPVGDGHVEEAGRDVVGGRLVLELPLQGLAFGASGYTGLLTRGGDDIRRSAVGAHLDYTGDRLWWRSEIARAMEPDQHATAFYTEAAWFLTPQWQLAGRYDRLDTHVDFDASVAPSLLDHSAWTAGLNFWPAPEFVLRASVEFVRGNRLAGPEPEELAEVIADGELERTTRVLQLGAQFSF